MSSRPILRRAIEVEIAVGAEDLAALFCDMGDIEQAAVFVQIASIAATWSARADNQWYLVGRQLARPIMVDGLALLRRLVEFADLYLAEPEIGVEP